MTLPEKMLKGVLTIKEFKTDRPKRAKTFWVRGIQGNDVPGVAHSRGLPLPFAMQSLNKTRMICSESAIRLGVMMLRQYGSHQ